VLISCLAYLESRLNEIDLSKSRPKEILTSFPSWDYISFPIPEVATFLVEECIREALVKLVESGELTLMGKEVNLPFAIAAVSGQGKSFTLRMFATLNEWNATAHENLKTYVWQLFDDMKNGKSRETDRILDADVRKEYRARVLDEAENIWKFGIVRFPQFENYIFIPISFNGDCCMGNESSEGIFYPLLSRLLFNYRNDGKERWQPFMERLQQLNKNEYKGLLQELLSNWFNFLIDKNPFVKVVLLMDQVNAFVEEFKEVNSSAGDILLSFITALMDSYPKTFTAIVSAVSPEPFLDFQSHSKRPFIPLRLISLNPAIVEVDTDLLTRAFDKPDVEKDSEVGLKILQLIVSLGGHGRCMATLVDKVISDQNLFSKVKLQNDVLMKVAEMCHVRYADYSFHRLLIRAAVLGERCDLAAISSALLLNQYSDTFGIPIVPPFQILLIVSQTEPTSCALTTNERTVIKNFFSLLNSNNGANFEVFIAHWLLTRKILLFSLPSTQPSHLTVSLEHLFHMASDRFPGRHNIRLTMPLGSAAPSLEINFLVEALLSEIKRAKDYLFFAGLTETFFKSNNPSNPGYDLLHFLHTDEEFIVLTIQAKCHFEERRLVKDIAGIHSMATTGESSALKQDSATTVQIIVDSYWNTKNEIGGVLEALSSSAVLQQERFRVRHYHLIWVWRFLPERDFLEVKGRTNNDGDLLIFQMDEIQNMLGGTCTLHLDAIAGMAAYWKLNRSECTDSVGKMIQGHNNP
jgi:hypothetical protein